MVTGALGNVGGYVAKHLISRGEQVVCADISPDRLSEKYGTAAQPKLFDFTDSSTYVTALEGVDRVFIMRPPHLGR